MRRTLMGPTVLAVLAALTAGGCGEAAKTSANAALSALSASYQRLKDEVATYLPPDQSKALSEAFTAIKEQVSKGDYVKAVTDIDALKAKVQQAEAAIAANKADLVKTWHEVDASMPDVFQTIEKQLNQLSSAKRLPAGVTKETVAAGKSALEATKKTWDEAVTAFKGANLKEAASKAGAVKKKTGEIMKSLGMPVPGFLS